MILRLKLGHLIIFKVLLRLLTQKVLYGADNSPLTCLVF